MRCGSCCKPSYNKCGGCRRVGYCNTSCQKKDWNKHINMCLIGGVNNSTKWTLERLVSFVESGKEIGRGGAGVVYTNNEIDRDAVVKRSASKNICRDYSLEFTKAIDLYQRMETIEWKSSVIRMIQPFAYAVDEGGSGFCYIAMERVQRPPYLLDIDSKLALHAYIGEEKADSVRKINGRGIYLGLDHVVLLTKTDAPTLVSEIARFISSVHYGCKYTGSDMEYIIDANGGIRIVDFDRIEEIVNYDKESIHAMVWAMESEPYFPHRDQPELFEIFERIYIETARVYNAFDIATQVMRQYDE